MLTIISTIFVLGILIFFHELGHFLTAKKLGVKVDKFSMGMGPKIFGFVRGETEYLISAIPMGGYVKMAGEELEEEASKDTTPVPTAEDARMFYNQTVGKRVLITLAGSLMNYVFGLIVFVIIFMAGVPTLTSKIGSIQENSPAAEAGIKAGDKITAIDNLPIWKWEEMAKIIQDSAGKKLLFTIDRDGGKIELEIIPRIEERTNVFMEKVKVGMIGIGSSSDFVKEHFGPIQSIKKGTEEAFSISWNIIKGIYFMATRKIKADIAGPVGIIRITGEQAKQGFLNLLFFAALLSINLGLINLLPIPPLDGGMSLFFLIEKIKGSPIKVKYRLITQQIGWALLILLLFFATYNDILRIGVKSVLK